MDDDRREDAASAAPQSRTVPLHGRRLWRVPLLCLLLLVPSVVALLASGLPQRHLIPKAVQQVLGADVSMAVRSTWNRVELGDILVREPNAPGLPPLVRAEALSMPWTLFGPRHFPSLCITGLEINLDGSDPQHANFGWVRRFMAQPSSGWNLLPYTPANVTVAPVRLTASLPGGMFALEGAGAGGLVLTAVMDSMQQYKIGLVGDDAEIRWTLPGIPPQIFTKNGIRLQVEADATNYAAAMDLRLPKEDRIQGAIRVAPEGGETVAEVSLKDSALRQPIWPELTAAFLPVPVRFTAAECPAMQARLRRTSFGWELEKVDLRSRIKGLALGPVASPWFFGDIQLASANPPGDAQFAATAVINDLPPMLFHWGGQKDRWKLGAVLDKWTREQLVSLLSSSARTVMFQYLPFEIFSLSSEVSPGPDGWVFSVDAHLQQEEGGNGPLAVQTQGSWANGALSAAARASMGEGTALELKELRYDRATGKASGAVTGSVELAPLAKLAGYPSLWGTARVDAKVTGDVPGMVQIAPLHATFETLGYGGFGIPYGVELDVSAPTRYGKEGLDAEFVEMTLGADTTVKAAKIAWNADRLSASDLRLETGLGPLVSKGWLAVAEGHASVRCASMNWPVPEPQSAIEYEAAFARLDLPAGWGTVKGLAAKGQLNWGNAADGAGSIAAVEATAAGVTLHGICAALRMDGANVVMEKIAFGLFGGAVSGEARFAPLDSAPSVSLTSMIDKIDLDVFTSEYKPPSTRLTGLAGGSVSASLDLNGLRALDVDLKTDGPMTMNRDLVEQLLASEYLSGMSGGKQVGQLLRDVVGDAPQIPFTGAAVKLGLEAGRITGTARLESEKLNLTLDIKADPGALLEALRARSGGAAVEKTPQ